MKMLQIRVSDLPRRLKKLARKRPAGAPVPIEIKKYLRRKFPREGPPKKEWGPGPWQDEPDFLAFVHHGLKCAIVRNTHVTGALNGYVAIPPTHPWWGKDYHECVATPQCEPEPPPNFAEWPISPPPVGSRIRASMLEPRWRCEHTPESILEAHGGITYSGEAFWPDAPKDLSWGFGFDCAHAWDVSPMMNATLRNLYLTKPNGVEEWAARNQLFTEGPMGQTYKDLAYVREQVERLAEQLATIGGIDGRGEGQTN